MSKRGASSKPDPSISATRAARIYRILKALAQHPRDRSQLIRISRAGMRTFYRDLNFLQECRISVKYERKQYRLTTSWERTMARLPFPPLLLSFREVMELADVPSPAGQKVRVQLNKVVGRAAQLR